MDDVMKFLMQYEGMTETDKFMLRYRSDDRATISMIFRNGTRASVQGGRSGAYSIGNVKALESVEVLLQDCATPFAIDNRRTLTTGDNNEPIPYVPVAEVEDMIYMNGGIDWYACDDAYITTMKTPPSDGHREIRENIRDFPRVVREVSNESAN